MFQLWQAAAGGPGSAAGPPADQGTRRPRSSRAASEPRQSAADHAANLHIAIVDNVHGVDKVY